MTKAQLITWSCVRDFLDIIVIGQIPGINWLLDIPMLVMHLKYAGPVALFTLLEAIPGVGFIPIWTIAAMSYANHDTSSAPPAPAPTYRPAMPQWEPAPDESQERYRTVRYRIEAHVGDSDSNQNSTGN